MTKPSPAPDDAAFAAAPPAPMKDPRFDWLFKGIGILISAIVIGGGSAVCGGLYQRLVDAEEGIHELEKVDATSNTEFNTRIKNLEEATKKQWELISENGKGIAGLKTQ